MALSAAASALSRRSFRRGAASFAATEAPLAIHPFRCLDLPAGRGSGAATTTFLRQLTATTTTPTAGAGGKPAAAPLSLEEWGDNVKLNQKKKKKRKGKGNVKPARKKKATVSVRGGSAPRAKKKKTKKTFGQRQHEDDSEWADHPLLTFPPKSSTDRGVGEDPYRQYLLLTHVVGPPPAHSVGRRFHGGGFHGGSGGGHGGPPPLPRSPFPILDGSPYLDPAGYCRSSARPSGTVTISGGDAARRLVEGRRRMADVLGGRLTNYVRRPGEEEEDELKEEVKEEAKDEEGATERDGSGGEGEGEDASGPRGNDKRRLRPPRTAPTVESSSKPQRQKSVRRRPQHRLRAFALSGHGVPPQLLRDHVDCADGLLTALDDAAEVGFNSYRRGRRHQNRRGQNDDGGNGDELEFDWMRVRSRSGDNDPFPWPPPPPPSPLDDASERPHWDGYVHRIDLYLAVMNRLAVTLRTALEDSCRYNGRNRRGGRHRSALPSTSGEEKGGPPPVRDDGVCGAGYDEGFDDGEFDGDGEGSPPEAGLDGEEGYYQDEYEAFDSSGSGEDPSGRKGGTPVLPRRWNVEFLRGLVYPPSLIPDMYGSSNDVSKSDVGGGLISPPIVELTQRGSGIITGNNTSAAGGGGGGGVDGHVRISIQGFPSAPPDDGSERGKGRRLPTAASALRRRRRRRTQRRPAEPLTVVFDAKFGEESDVF